MNLIQEKAFFHLTGKLKLSQINTETLKQFIEEAPYFTPARFFHVAKQKENNRKDELLSLSPKTNLYFTNPYWLQYHLDEVSVLTKTEPAPELSSTEKIEKAAEFAIPTVEAVKELMRKIDHNQETQREEEEPMPDEYIEEADAIAGMDESDSKIAGILSSQLADFKKPIEADAVLEIDAERKKLHTIDYFASQGIKIDLSSIPQDKLTTHLRKFTDWLKQVKTTQSGTPGELTTSLEMEKAVAETAKNSNETREIVTETMADVLEKQGQIDKAIQLYIKLSFLNPEKSSYFAAKIEQLKGI